MENEKYFTEKKKELTDLIIRFMLDENILSKDKKCTAIALSGLLIYKSALNVDDGMKMFERAIEGYIQINDDKNRIQPN